MQQQTYRSNLRIPNDNIISMKQSHLSKRTNCVFDWDVVLTARFCERCERRTLLVKVGKTKTGSSGRAPLHLTVILHLTAPQFKYVSQSSSALKHSAVINQIH